MTFMDHHRSSPKIAIPEPTSLDSSYNARTLPQYVMALQSAGATVVVIPLHERPDRIAKLLATTQGALLPGSRYDIDPQVYGESRIAACNETDPARSAVDELLLQDAFNLHKPLLGICGGMQSLNVWRNGTLIQDLAVEGLTSVDHAPGREVSEAHPLVISAESRLQGLLPDSPLAEHVNSSHHQAVKVAGDNLAVTGTSPVDGVVEAIELKSPDHFVLGVQWHPERTVAVSALSRAIFREFVKEASQWKPQPTQEAAVSE